MIDSAGARQNFVQHLLEDGVRILTFLGSRAGEEGLQLPTSPELPRSILPEIRPPIDDVVDHLVPQAPHLVGWKLQSRAGTGVDSVFQKTPPGMVG
jgi:hypothetical protein